MGSPQIIAIDGPAGSGKSTVGKLVAEHLGYLFFDTGVMYRAVTLAVIQQGIDVHDEVLVSNIAETIDIGLQTPSILDGRDCDILLDGKDVTWDIRSPEIDGSVSIISAYPRVRQILSEKQRRIGLQGRVVMLGRDIGTVVLPEADLKVYLDASVEERARRRYLERIKRGEKVDYDLILTMLRERDQIDSTRKIAPLKPADDAIVINTDGLNIQQVFESVLALIEKDRVQ
ncbi:MAG: (d)CMP kinase [Chloroflexota bacterium]|nr:MAG: (d)CMP kinase [Chloroflexota bacterium]